MPAEVASLCQSTSPRAAASGCSVTTGSRSTSSSASAQRCSPAEQAGVVQPVDRGLAAPRPERQVDNIDPHRHEGDDDSVSRMRVSPTSGTGRRGEPRRGPCRREGSGVGSHRAGSRRGPTALSVRRRRRWHDEFEFPDEPGRRCRCWSRRRLPARRPRGSGASIQETTDRAALAGRLGRGPGLRLLGSTRPPTACTSGTWSGCWCCAGFRRPATGRRAGGGATGMVGDPSGRSEERELLDDASLGRQRRRHQGADRHG